LSRLQENLYAKRRAEAEPSPKRSAAKDESSRATSGGIASTQSEERKTKVSYTEKHLAFHAAHGEVARIDEAIASHNLEIEKLRAERVAAESICDARASEAAEEKIAAGFAGIEMPDGTLRLCERSRRGKKTAEAPDGTPPKYPFKVSDKVLR
jgi:hypothetical protein